MNAYIVALLRGFTILHALSLPILGSLAAIAWLRNSLPAIRAWIHPGEVWASALLMLISVVIYMVLLTNLQPWASGLFDWAAALGGRIGGVGATVLLSPSSIFATGATTVSPIQDFLRNLAQAGVWATLKALPTILNFSVAYFVVIVAFMGIALNISLTIIEFYFALMCSTVLIPWAPLAGTAFLAEFALGWTAGMIVRMLIQTAVVGISMPLFEHLVVVATPGGDPLWWESLSLVGGAVFFFVLSWIIPNRAVSLASRGMALGIGGDVVTAGFGKAASQVRGAWQAGTRVAAGVSTMIRAQRGTP